MELRDIVSNKKYRVIISGGGTGGHFYPAVAIAEQLKERYGDDIEILFVGAYGKMEMEKIPAMGWNIIGLPIVGLQRKISLGNCKLLFKVISSYIKSKKIIKKFNPDVVVGFGGYVTLPIVSCAARNGVATMIWEGNSVSGMANRVLCKKAKKIFVSFENMDNVFCSKKIVVSGNPLRGGLEANSLKREEGYDYFLLDRNKPTLFVTGGSLGTAVLNNAIIKHFDSLIESNEINLIWQCGSAHSESVKNSIKGKKPANFFVQPFIDRMDLAYNVADIVIARSGASTLSELALIGRASILVPSSHVADNHQEKNARCFADKDAAIVVLDKDTDDNLMKVALALLKNKEEIKRLESNIKQFAQPNSAKIISDEIACYLK